MKDCKLIRGGEAFHGKQHLNYFSGVSAESANSDAICMHMVVIPPRMPHHPYNPTDRIARAIIARTDPKEQESVVLV